MQRSYNDAIFKLQEILGWYHLNPQTAPARHIWNQFIIRVQGGRRDALREHLSENGIGTDIYYPVPLHQQECFASYQRRCRYRTRNVAALETVALPIFPELETRQIEDVPQTRLSIFLNNRF